MPDSSPISEKIIDNTQRQCSVKHCYNYRFRIGPYCRKHRNAKRYWGHPEAKAIRRRDYSCEMEDVINIIELNPDHPGIKRGIDFFQGFLEDAANGSRLVPCPELIARLHVAGVRPLDILTEMAALWLLHDQQGGLIKSDLHLYHLMGSRLIRFIRYPGRTRGTQHFACGEYVRKNVGVLLVNISRTVEQKWRKENNFEY